MAASTIAKSPHYRYATAKALNKPLSAYLRESFHYTTSGMGWQRRSCMSMR